MKNKNTGPTQLPSWGLLTFERHWQHHDISFRKRRPVNKKNKAAKHKNRLMIIARWIVLFFGLFIMGMGIVMLFFPKKGREIIQKAGSTNFINYAEISIRMIPAIAMIMCAGLSKFPLAFTIFGWTMLVTSFILFLVPRKVHHAFSMKSANTLKPIYLQLISPFAFLLGGFILYNANWI
ncbi:MAG: hypothetical protein R2793_05445 [Flavobacteriaceae bacterium]